MTTTQIAIFIRRGFAFLIDCLLSLILILVLMNFFNNSLYNLTGIDKSVLIPICAVFLFQLYFFLFELIFKGKTPGKFLFNIHLVNSEGGRPNLIQSFIRNFSRVLNFIPPFFILNEIMLFLILKKRFADWLANTEIVQDAVEEKIVLRSKEKILLDKFILDKLTVNLTPPQKNLVIKFYKDERFISKSVKDDLLSNLLNKLSQRLTNSWGELKEIDHKKLFVNIIYKLSHG